MLLNELYREYNGTAHMSKEPVAPFQICLGWDYVSNNPNLQILEIKLI